MSLRIYAADPGGKEAIPPEPEVLSQLTNSSGTPQERGERLLSLIFPAEWMATHPDPRTYFPDATEPVDLSAVSGQTHALSVWEGVYDKLDAITSPTLLITGDKDQIAPAENSVRIAEGIPSSKIIQIKEGGHGVMYQYPEEFSRYVIEFRII